MHNCAKINLNTQHNPELAVEAKDGVYLEMSYGNVVDAIAIHNFSEQAHPYILALISNKQDKINDLDEIRAGAAKAMDALQKNGDNLTTSEWEDSITTHNLNASIISEGEQFANTIFGWSENPLDNEEVVANLITYNLAGELGGSEYIFYDFLGNLNLVDSNGYKTKYCVDKITHTTIVDDSAFEVDYALPQKIANTTLATILDIPPEVTETTVSNWGFTKNTGTVKSVNNTQPDSNGNVTLSIPTVNNPTIKITQGGIEKGSFSLNQSSGDTIALDAGGGLSSDWGETLHGNVVVNSEFVCAPYKCYQSPYITSISMPNVVNAHLAFCFSNCYELESVNGFSDITKIESRGFSNCFTSCISLTTIPSFSNITTIGEGGANSCFSYCNSLQSVSSFGNVETIGKAGMQNCFNSCISLVNVPTFDKIISIDESGLQQCFQECTSLQTAPTFENLQTVNASGLRQCFYNCTSLTTAPLFSKLSSILGNGLMQCFYNCRNLTSISFPALTTNSFSTGSNHFTGLISGVTGCTIHFPSNLQSTISGITGYPNFGGTNTVLAFDLPATS